MPYKKKTPFVLSLQKQWGVFLLLLLLFLTELFLFSYPSKEPDLVDGEMMTIHQKALDSLKRIHEQKQAKVAMYPFNPNYITDYKVYTLGLPVEVFDRLSAFRKQGKFVNSSQEFQKVTGIHDTLLKKLAPYFKFPSWVKNRETKKASFKKRLKKDINLATLADFKKVPGIGIKLSERIVKYRNYLSGFAMMEQCYEVYGLDSTVVKRMFDFFEIRTLPKIEKKSLNTISLKELERIPYLTKEEARKVIVHRTKKGTLNMNDLLILLGIDAEKEARLNFYLY